MPSQPSFGLLGDAGVVVEPPSAESPFRLAILGDFSGRGSKGEKISADAMIRRKPGKISRSNLDDIITLFKVQVKIPQLQGEALEHSFETLDDFHPDQIHEKVDRFAFVSDEDDKAELMAALLHHPLLQTVESAWRGVDWLLRRAQKGGNKVEVVLYDIHQEELAADLNADNDLSKSAVYQLLIEQAMQGPKGQPWTLWLGLYHFNLNVRDAQVLGRMARIAQKANVPFLAGVTSQVLNDSFVLEGDDAKAWAALRQLPESAWVGLAVPDFLVRLPYGENTQSVERFSFEEFARFKDKKGYLWGNAALAVAALMTQSFLKDGWGFKPGSVLDLDSMLLHAYVQDDEEEATLAEAWLTRTMVEKFIKLGLMPIMSVKGRNAMQLARYLSLAQPPKDQQACDLQGRWGQVGMPGTPRPATRPGMTVSTQFAPPTPSTQTSASHSMPPPNPPQAAPPGAAPAAVAQAAAQHEGTPESPAEEGIDPELAALMAQFESTSDTTAPAAPQSPTAAAPPVEEALDPELAALMAQFDTPAAPETPAAAAAAAAAAAQPEAAAAAPEEGLDPELAALMKQMEGGT